MFSNLPITTLLQLVQLSTAVLLVTFILLQQRGTGLGSAFGGGEGNVFATRRGIERWLFIATVVVSIVFLGSALLSLLIK